MWANVGRNIEFMLVKDLEAEVKRAKKRNSQKNNLLPTANNRKAKHRKTIHKNQ